MKNIATSGDEEIVGRLPIGEDPGNPHRLHKVKGDEHMVSHLHMPNRGIYT